MKEVLKNRWLVHCCGLVVTVFFLALFMHWELDQTVTVYAFSTADTSPERGEYLEGTDIEGGSITEPGTGIMLYYQIYGAKDNRQVSISGYNYSGQGSVTLQLPGYISHGKDDASRLDYKVVGVNGGAFKNFSDLKSVSFASTYQWIGAEAFMNCSLQSGLNLNDELEEIRARSFYGCTDLTEVTIGNRVKKIETGAFANCPKLERIAVAGGNRSYCSIGYVLYSYDKSVLIQCPAALKTATAYCTEVSIGSDSCPVRVIGDRAFEGCTMIQKIEINHPTITTIGEKAFYGCSALTSAKIPSTVTTIGDAAFSNCSPWFRISCDSGSYAETFAKSYGLLTDVTCTVKFYDGTALLKTEEVPLGGAASAPVVPERSGYTLTWDKSYTNVQQNLEVHTAWKQNYTVTFKDAYSGQVTEVTSYYGGAATPPVWTRKGYVLEWDTTSYTYVTKNMTVNAVWLINMTDVVIEDEKPKIGDTRTIGNVTYQVTRVTDSDPRVKAVGCTKQTLTTLTIPDTITFGGYNFKVTNIGKNAFRDMPNLTTLTLSKHLIKINRAAFYNCPKLKNITIRSKKMTTVVEKAFTKTYVKAKVNVPNAYIKKYKSYLRDAGLSVYATVY